MNPVTVREFLSWFHARRRGVSIVARIREELGELSLVTVPDFEEPWIDGLITFQQTVVVSAEGTATGVSSAEAVAVIEAPNPPFEGGANWEHREAGYRLSRFEAANKPVTSIGPEAPLTEAITIMMLNDFSQLPVMTNERDVRGVITWSEIATRSVLGNPGSRAVDFTVDPTILDDTNSIFDAIQAVVSRDFILVRDRQRRISGIVTAADLSLQFRALSEPFLLLSEIETHVRNLIGTTFSAQELGAARAPGSSHEVHSVADLTFGEYVFLLQNPENWTRLGVMIDRQAFCHQLERIRSIRNQVMHFDPDGLDGEDIKVLREFSSFLKRIEMISN